MTRWVIEGAIQLKQDLDVNAYDKRGRTALIYAVLNNNPKVLEMILGYKQIDGQKAQIKWRDELSKDVCDYANDDTIKQMLSKYVEDNDLQYHNYYVMKTNMGNKVQVKKGGK